MGTRWRLNLGVIHLPFPPPPPAPPRPSSCQAATARRFYPLVTKRPQERKKQILVFDLFYWMKRHSADDFSLSETSTMTATLMLWSNCGGVELCFVGWFFKTTFRKIDFFYLFLFIFTVPFSARSCCFVLCSRGRHSRNLSDHKIYLHL